MAKSLPGYSTTVQGQKEPYAGEVEERRGQNKVPDSNERAGTMTAKTDSGSSGAGRGLVPC